MSRIHFVVVIDGPLISADDPQNDARIAAMIADGIASARPGLPAGSRWSVQRIFPEAFRPAPVPIALGNVATVDASLLMCGHCSADIVGDPNRHVCKGRA